MRPARLLATEDFIGPNELHDFFLKRRQGSRLLRPGGKEETTNSLPRVTSSCAGAAQAGADRRSRVGRPVFQFADALGNRVARQASRLGNQRMPPQPRARTSD